MRSIFMRGKLPFEPGTVLLLPPLPVLPWCLLLMATCLRSLIPSRLAPWRGDCAHCALHGKRCSYASLPAVNDDLGTDEGGAAHTCGRAAAQAIWFATLREKLPRRLRQLCLARLEAVMTQGGGGEAKASPSKAECLADGAALTWPKPRPKMRLKELKERAAARAGGGGTRAGAAARAAAAR